jgi:hypothetical protein
MARKRCFRFGLPTVLAGRPPVGGIGLGCQPIRFAAAASCGALGSGWPDSVLSHSKSPRRIFRRGLNSCDDEDMQVICLERYEFRLERTHEAVIARRAALSIFPGGRSDRYSFIAVDRLFLAGLPAHSP